LSLYNEYDLELSNKKLFKGIFNGALNKVKAGKKLFKKPIKQDGNTNRVGAEFLIDENGNILISHYGRFVGDDLSIEVYKKQLK
jgi:thioredoxin-dependent peroxiredoxin